ncbi:MAG: exodeoxyribonuclease VII large subunit [Thermoleophilia bacterium]|nr:exodeoxyribonuclease VII large subunit [Thermoleophilia bacterium]
MSGIFPGVMSAASPRIFEVNDVVTALERVIADHTRIVRIRGEVVNLRSGRDGRMYWFRLEDTRDGMDARLDCFAWSTDVADGFVLSDGGVIEAVAQPEFSRRDGRLTIHLRRIEPAGEGELLRMIEERRRRLTAEGLFESARKRPLPFVPRCVGLITAAGSSARADVLQRIESRFAVPVVVVHAAMQGVASVREITRALAILDADERVDVILITRGGGSLQDLLPFSDEGLVRAIRAGQTPVVAGIGHEPDVTLVCLAADATGATPTAAADLVVPDRVALRERTGAMGRRLASGSRRAVERARRDLDLVGIRPGLARRHDAVLRAPRERVAVLGTMLVRSVRGITDPASRAITSLADRRVRGMDSLATAGGSRVAILAARLGGNDPERPLADGFAVVRDASGGLVTSAAAATAAGHVMLTFADDTVPADVRPKGDQ